MDNYKVQEILDWFEQFNGKKLKIVSETNEFHVKLNNGGITHLLGLQYANYLDSNNNRIKGFKLINYIKNNNISDENILDEVRSKNPIMLRSVNARIDTFEGFMRNIEKAYIFENTKGSNGIDGIGSSHFMIKEGENKAFLHLGIKTNELNENYIYEFGTGKIGNLNENETQKLKGYLETYFSRNNLNYVDNSQIFEKVTSIEMYNKKTKKYEPFSFDEEKNKEYNDKEKALEVIRKNPSHYNKISSELKNDKDIAIETVKGDGKMLKFMSDELKKDNDVYTMAIIQNPDILREEFLNDIVDFENIKGDLDFDLDGLTNYEEKQRGTNIYSRDTDGDGKIDKDEKMKGDDPRSR